MSGVEIKNWLTCQDFVSEKMLELEIGREID